MKTHLTRILTFLLPVVAAWGCVKAPDTVKPTGGGSKVSELIVPSGFEWNTAENVVCDISSPHVTRIALSVGRNSQPFAVLVVGDAGEPATLSIPTCMNTVSRRLRR